MQFHNSDTKQNVAMTMSGDVQTPNSARPSVTKYKVFDLTVKISENIFADHSALVKIRQASDKSGGQDYILMTTWHGKNFRITGPLWGESIGERWIPHTKVQ